MTPLVQYIDVHATPPSLQDNSADQERLKNAVLKSCAIDRLIIPWAQVTTVSKHFRQAKFSGTAVVNAAQGRFEIIDFLPSRPEYLVGMALDVGTTHLEAALIDMVTGDTLIQGNQENEQIVFGDDILSRIHHAGRGSGLSELNKAVLHSINQLAEGMAAKLGISVLEIRALSASGNPTMVHFLLGFDPANICREPYIPLVNAPDLCNAGELGITIHPAAPVFILPGVGSYFGGDLISGILASGLDEGQGVSMLIDVGTNAEVVIGNKEWLMACAGAAGPALEGGVAQMGMRAGPGAIDRIYVDSASGDITYSTIDNQPARGICGSGIIDLVAGLYLGEIIDMRGKFKNNCNGDRCTSAGDGKAYVVVRPKDTVDGRPIVLTQVDLDALMRSKAAMYAILTTLVSQVGLPFAELHKIYVAGAFGRHIDPEHAITLGMLPDLSRDTYMPIGNSSLAGAKMVLMEEKHRIRSLEIMKKITYVELNVNQEFMMRFSGAKFIPHTDHSLFPSVPSFNQ